ncbi:hypothetical protein HBH70_050400 [Parastagonospora nodorum]|nr:hypothetical protein HBH53_085270 [Parastagonospora nodorum]KAH4308243.1 hypothetical protein HBI01_041080 [Parastagonospora nodorum]KAH4313838.1 hypothetical protein HBI02_068560 [Parastagonospora nodorum]KAH4333707.1 hypothetical protein HBI00_039250 [Parastagonospora nodorum]KAH4379309.1 hypothetical protein HBH94_081220 [Parastagonospora nodorum]
MAKASTTSVYHRLMAEAMTIDFHFSDNDLSEATEQRLAELKRKEQDLRKPGSPIATLKSDIETLQSSCQAFQRLKSELWAAEMRQARAEESLRALRPPPPHPPMNSESNTLPVTGDANTIGHLNLLVRLLKDDAERLTKERDEHKQTIDAHARIIEAQQVKIASQKATIDTQKATIDTQKATIESQKAKIESQKRTLTEYSEHKLLCTASQDLADYHKNHKTCASDMQNLRAGFNLERDRLSGEIANVQRELDNLRNVHNACVDHTECHNVVNLLRADVAAAQAEHTASGCTTLQSQLDNLAAIHAQCSRFPTKQPPAGTTLKRRPSAKKAPTKDGACSEEACRNERNDLRAKYKTCQEEHTDYGEQQIANDTFRMQHSDCEAAKLKLESLQSSADAMKKASSEYTKFVQKHESCEATLQAAQNECENLRKAHASCNLDATAQARATALEQQVTDFFNSISDVLKSSTVRQAEWDAYVVNMRQWTSDDLPTLTKFMASMLDVCNTYHEAIADKIPTNIKSINADRDKWRNDCAELLDKVEAQAKTFNEVLSGMRQDVALRDQVIADLQFFSTQE